MPRFQARNEFNSRMRRQEQLIKLAFLQRSTVPIRRLQQLSVLVAQNFPFELIYIVKLIWYDRRTQSGAASAQYERTRELSVILSYIAALHSSFSCGDIPASSFIDVCSPISSLLRPIRRVSTSLKSIRLPFVQLPIHCSDPILQKHQSSRIALP